jgi:hypothetical protein
MSMGKSVVKSQTSKELHADFCGTLSNVFGVKFADISCASVRDAVEEKNCDGTEAETIVDSDKRKPNNNKKDDDGHIILKLHSRTPQEVDSMCAVVDSVLCPTAEAVLLTDKPNILAATKGPLGKYFKVPPYLEIGEESSNECSLIEAKLFAQTIGYPVVFKGKRQGADICKNWSKLQSKLKFGGFIQKKITGWEKCLAFAAFEGELTGVWIL